jgi:hypothetical protein
VRRYQGSFAHCLLPSGITTREFLTYIFLTSLNVPPRVGAPLSNTPGGGPEAPALLNEPVACALYRVENPIVSENIAGSGIVQSRVSSSDRLPVIGTNRQ